MTEPRLPLSGPLPRRVHLVGIGGAAMSGIATILLARGHELSGSDRQTSATADALAGSGVRVFEGHDAANLGEAEVVIASAAIDADNVELAEARRRGTPIITRARAIARIIEGTKTLAVAGTHGKTTTSALAVSVLRAAGVDPTFLVGSEVVGLDVSAASGRDPYAVIEADEYARAFLEYAPTVAIITNLEPDHLDYYDTYEALQDAFAGFAGRVAADGRIIACADSPDLIATLAAAAPSADIETYGIDARATWRAVDIRRNTAGGHDFAVVRDGSEYVRISIGLPGLHNVANATAVVVASAALGLPPDAAALGLAEARGTRRRFELVGEAADVAIFDDYAHHPTEVRATLAAARDRFGERRIVVCFQPHTEARTGYLLDEFRRCFAEADALYVLESFAARNTGMGGVAAEQLARAIERPAARYVASHEAARGALLAELRPGDVLFTMGAGDVDRLGPMVLDALRRGTAG